MERKQKLSLVILSALFLLSAALTVSFGLKYVGGTQGPQNEMTRQADSVATFMANYYQTATAQPSPTPSPTPTNTPSLAAPKLLPPTATTAPTPTPNPHAEELQQRFPW
jgi:hypothetical protein